MRSMPSPHGDGGARTDSAVTVERACGDGTLCVDEFPPAAVPMPPDPSCGERAKPKKDATENALVIVWWRSKTSPSTSHCESSDRKELPLREIQGEEVAPR